MNRRLCALLLAALALLLARRADAFCGFYVSGADAKLFNNATQVVMMRDGTRTVLSMQNNYQGPPSDFAMVVPVPVVLQKENVKTLPRDLFAKLDQLDSPRLVEYWEQDPCYVPPPVRPMAVARGGAMPPSPAAAPETKDLGVKVEAQFTVGEYEVVILSAKDAGGLDTWLRREKYKIPEGSEPYFRPYVVAGSKFFVARVDAKKVTFDAKGMATLSPLRFHYDTEQFTLPVRLGLVNSGGTQDLVVHILAKGQRYEVANYPNVTIPTNFDVAESARGSFGSFYASLFDRTIEKNPRAVVTEYAWDAGTCDPCPGPALDGRDLTTLGADVTGPAASPNGGRMGFFPAGYVITRLHARYGKESLGDDLVFKAAGAIVGGREMMSTDKGLEHGATPSSTNNFQGRYAIRHPWGGPIACKDPVRGRWGGPPGGTPPEPTKPATNLAFVPRTAKLASFVSGAIPELDVKGEALPVSAVVPAGAAPAPPAGGSPDASSLPSPDAGSAPSAGRKGCATSGPDHDGPTWLVVGVPALVLLARRRRALAARRDLS